MRSRLLLSGCAALVLTAAALIFTMSAGAKQAAPAPAVTSCYPGNEDVTNGAGDTSGSLTGFTSKVAFELEPIYNGKDRGATRRRLGTLQVDAAMDITGTALTGSFNATWQIKGKNGKGSFTASCIQEGSTAAFDTGATDDWEAEYEGTVHGLPWSTGDQPAVASITAHRSTESKGGIIVHLSIEQGFTCDEYTGELTASNQENGKWIKGATGSVTAPDTSAGRWGLPGAFDPADSNPCQDVFA